MSVPVQRRPASAAPKKKEPPHLAYLSPAALDSGGNLPPGGRATSPIRPGSGGISRSQGTLSRPGTAPSQRSAVVSPTQRHRSRFRGTTFLKDSSQREGVLPRPLSSGITYAAQFASFEELMERNILEQKAEDMVSLSTEDASTIYHAKCVDQRLVPSWEREARFLELLSQNCKGMFFELKENGLGPHATQAICQVLARNTWYSILELSGNRLRDTGSEYIAELLRVNTTVVHLCLRSNDIGQEGGRRIAEALQHNNTLTSLDLSGISGINRNHLGLKGAEAMGQALSVNKTLCIINLGSNGLGPEGLERLKRGLEGNESVTDLNLSSNNLGSDGAAILADALDGCCIKILNIDRNNIGDRGAAALAAVMKPPHYAGDHLEEISLAHNNIRSAGIEQLAKALPSAPGMRVIVLEGNHCGETGGYQIALAMRDTSIVEWHLSNCEIVSSHGQTIGDAIAYRGIVEVLDISRNMLGDEGMIPILKAAGGHPRLRLLNIDNVGTTNEIGQHIAAMIASSQTLQELHTRQNRIKESGNLISDVMRKNSSIIVLDTLYNDFSYKAYTSTEHCIARNRKTWNHNAVPRLSAEIAELNMSDKELRRVQDEMDMERRSLKEKMEEGFRRKETAKNHLEAMRNHNAEFEAQLSSLKEVTAELERRYQNVCEVRMSEQTKMNGKYNVMDQKRRTEEDRRAKFNERRDIMENKLKVFHEMEAESLKAPREEVRHWEQERDREKADAKVLAESLTQAQLRLLDLRIQLNQASLVASAEMDSGNQ